MKLPHQQKIYKSKKQSFYSILEKKDRFLLQRLHSVGESNMRFIKMRMNCSQCIFIPNLMVRYAQQGNNRRYLLVFGYSSCFNTVCPKQTASSSAFLRRFPYSLHIWKRSSVYRSLTQYSTSAKIKSSRSPSGHGKPFDCVCVCCMHSPPFHHTPLFYSS